METFFSDDDLLGLLQELDSMELEEEEMNEEVKASERRFREIIEKHKM